MKDEFDLQFEEEIRAISGSSYKTLQLLGQGGNAATYLMIARTGPFRGVPFAVKFFRRLSKPEWKDAFLREAEFLNSCDHPAVMRYVDRGVAREQNPYFVAEYLPITLREAIQSGRVSAIRKVSFATQLLSALVHLSGLPHPVVHRDVKPENIFIKGESAVLGDFGLMKVLPSMEDDQEFLKASLGPGMPRRYRTPDLVAYLTGGQPPTPKSDVYQLGLVLAELFTGRNPQVRIADHEGFAAEVKC